MEEINVISDSSEDEKSTMREYDTHVENKVQNSREIRRGLDFWEFKKRLRC